MKLNRAVAEKSLLPYCQIKMRQIAEWNCAKTPNEKQPNR
jgi:hypothetical protein